MIACGSAVHLHIYLSRNKTARTDIRGRSIRGSYVRVAGSSLDPWARLYDLDASPVPHPGFDFIPTIFMPVFVR